MPGSLPIPVGPRADRTVRSVFCPGGDAATCVFRSRVCSPGQPSKERCVMDDPGSHLSPEHRALLRFLSRVHQDNGLRPLRIIAAAMHLRSKSRVSCLLRGDNNTLPADETQLDALVLALGGGTDELRRARELYRKARRSRGISRRVARTPPARRDMLVGRQRELDLIHGRVYASHADGGLTGPVSAVLTSIRKALDWGSYLRIERAE